MLNHAAQSGCHPLSARGADLYETPACATEALLRAEQLPHCIWEPAAGRGAIVDVLRGHGDDGWTVLQPDGTTTGLLIKDELAGTGT